MYVVCSLFPGLWGNALNFVTGLTLTLFLSKTPPIYVVRSLSLSFLGYGEML